MCVHACMHVLICVGSVLEFGVFTHPSVHPRKAVSQDLLGQGAGGIPARQHPRKNQQQVHQFPHSPMCSYVLTKKERNYISFFTEQEIRVEEAWWTMHGRMGTRTQGTGHQSLSDHIAALCPWHPYQSHWAGLPHPGSKVWVQSLLPGLGQPGHRDPSAFGLKRGLSPHSTPYRSSATSPPPCAFILGARVSVPVGLRGAGCQAWPCATTWVPKMGLSFSCCQCDPWAGPSYPGLRRFPGSPEVLAGRNLWAEPSCLKPECHLRQGCVSLSVMWAECQQGRGEVSCTALGTMSANRCSLSLGSLLETAAPRGPALPWRETEMAESAPAQASVSPGPSQPGLSLGASTDGRGSGKKLLLGAGGSSGPRGEVAMEGTDIGLPLLHHVGPEAGLCAIPDFSLSFSPPLPA